jgi:tetratricopeptide (TPR) repeat protein
MARQKSTHVDDPRLVGERVRAARAQAGLSQRQLAFPGCSPAYISRLEAGDRTPSLQVIRELGARLGVSAHYLAMGSESPDDALREAELALRFEDTDRAEELFRRILDESGDVRVRSQALEGLGQAAMRAGEPTAAIAHFQDALKLSGEDASTRASLAESLARAHAAMGELATAIELLERCVAYYEDDPLQYVRFAALLGFALTDNGNFAEAERIVAKALIKGRTVTDPYARARLYWSEFRLLTEEGEAARAEGAARKTLEILRTTEDEHGLALAFQSLAHICLDLERPTEALELLEEGWPLMSKTGTSLQGAQYRLEEARARAALADHETAAGLATEVTSALGQLHGVDQGRAYVLLGEIWESLGELERAQELYELAVELLEERAPTRYLIRAYKRLAQVLRDRGKRDEAFELLERALGVQERAGRMLH